MARGRVLVDGFHRWQAHRRERVEQIAAVDLGNLTDAEIVRESVQRNAAHGQQLSSADTRRLAGQLWRQFGHLKNGERMAEIEALLSVSRATVERWTVSARADELADQQANAYDRWLDCQSYREIGRALGVAHTTLENWCGACTAPAADAPPPESRQHVDGWSFPTAEGASSSVGRMPPQIVEHLVWGFTEPGQIVVDPFAGGGTTIDVAKRMGRRVWASDLTPSTPTLPIHRHDITTGWPSAAPERADLILLDPPYWKQAAGTYSVDTRDLANQTLDEFMRAWGTVVDACVPHLKLTGRLAFIISPTQDDERVVGSPHQCQMPPPGLFSWWWKLRAHDHLVVLRRFAQHLDQTFPRTTGDPAAARWEEDEKPVDVGMGVPIVKSAGAASRLAHRRPRFRF